MTPPSAQNQKRVLARLGVNVDHVATVRNLRGTPYPDVLSAAEAAIRGGAEQITVHLREDRRHIRDADVARLRKKLDAELNLEMAFTAEMLKIAKKTRPEWVCIVPEKRTEVTTEGGLDVRKLRSRLVREIPGLSRLKIRTSLFIEPDLKAVRIAAEVGAQAVELHTGRYCLATQTPRGDAAAKKELRRIQAAAELALTLGMRAHAGHGFDFENVRPVAALRRAGTIGVAHDGGQLIEEYNIGHALIAQALFVGIETATRQMLAAIRAP